MCVKKNNTPTVSPKKSKWQRYNKWRVSIENVSTKIVIWNATEITKNNESLNKCTPNKNNNATT